MSAVLNTILIYAKNPSATAEFYSKFFGFEATGEMQEGLIELHAPDAGTSILIHQAAKTVKLGQVGVKLMFSVRDVDGFKEESAQRGLVFGSTHQASGYAFANVKDPDGNSVAISSRAYRRTI